MNKHYKIKYEILNQNTVKSLFLYIRGSIVTIKIYKKIPSRAENAFKRRNTPTLNLYEVYVNAWGQLFNSQLFYKVACQSTLNLLVYVYKTCWPFCCKLCNFVMKKPLTFSAKKIKCSVCAYNVLKTEPLVIYLYNY